MNSKAQIHPKILLKALFSLFSRDQRLEDLARKFPLDKEYSTEDLSSAFTDACEICKIPEMERLREDFMSQPQLPWADLLKMERTHLQAKVFDQIEGTFRHGFSGVQFEGLDLPYYDWRLKNRSGVLGDDRDSPQLFVHLNFDFKDPAMSWFNKIPEGSGFAILCKDLQSKDFQTEEVPLKAFQRNSILNYSLACLNGEFYFYGIGYK